MLHLMRSLRSPGIQRQQELKLQRTGFPRLAPCCRRFFGSFNASQDRGSQYSSMVIFRSRSYLHSLGVNHALESDYVKTTMKMYSFHPLRSSSDDIRVLILLPGSMDDPIRCQLKVVTLQTKYEALSYTWGSESDTRPITVNDLELQVTSNLESALRHLRKEQERVLWIDALCINQRDLQEKESQIRCMREIYGSAEEVIVWLGLMTPKMTAAMDLMHSKPGYFPGIWSEENREITLDFARGLFERVWWTRLWVVQEILSARRVVFVCGKRSYSWTYLLQLVVVSYTTWVNPFSPLLREQSVHHPIYFISIYRNKLIRGETINLEDLIRVFYRHETKLPKDRVYGLLSIATDIDDFNLDLDYTKSDSSVFKGAAKCIILKRNALDFIFLGRGPGRLADLPTWTPDLTIPWERTPTSLIQPHLHKIVFSAAAKTAAAPTFSEDLATMTVTGVREDVISNVCTTNSEIEAIKVALGGENYPLAMKPYPRRQDYHPASKSSGIKRFSFKRGSRIIVPDEIETRGPENYYSACNRTLKCDMIDMQWRLQPGEGHFFQGEFEGSSYSYQYDRLKDQKKLMTSEKGYIGMVPAEAQPGDVICVLYGCSLPVVLRKLGYYYILVGECYVHGIMDGQVIDDIENNKTYTQKFNIK